MSELTDFRNTELGALPKEWDVRPLGKLLSFKNGVNAEKHAYGQGTPFVNVLETITHSHLHADDVTGRVTLPELLRSAYAVKRGDVLFNRTSETDADLALATTYVGSEDLVFGGFVIRGRPITAELDPDYCGYALRARALRVQIIPLGQGAVRANIGQGSLGQVLAPVPPLLEQRAIATVLSDIDALMSGLDRLIAKKRDLKQAAMQQLLTGKTRLPGFQGEWMSTTLGRVAKIQRGASPRPIDSPIWFDENSRVGWVRISDVTRSGMFLEHTTQRLSPLGVSHSRPVPSGSLIMSICATVGRPVITRIDVCIHDGFVVFDQLDADQKFLFYVLNWLEPSWGKHGQTGSQMNLNTGLINSAEVSLPCLEEQNAIAAILSDLDAELTALEARRDKTRALKQGMMQELLTGSTRLVDATPAVPVGQQAPTQERKANIHFLRAVLAAEIVDQLHQEPTFGHVKLEKMMFLTEHLCHVDTGSTYLRKAAGPLDRKALHSIDSQLRNQNWFDARKQGERYTYVPLAKRGGHKAYFDRHYAPIAAKLSEIIETFRALSTERCEIVATLYAAWNDLLRDKGAASDDAIVHEVLHHWHEAKQRISEDRWHKALGWMRGKGFVPQGVALP